MEELSREGEPRVHIKVRRTEEILGKGEVSDYDIGRGKGPNLRGTLACKGPSVAILGNNTAVLHFESFL